jgi:hypothetical protein
VDNSSCNSRLKVIVHFMEDSLAGNSWPEYWPTGSGDYLRNFTDYFL